MKRAKNPIDWEVRLLLVAPVQTGLTEKVLTASVIQALQNLGIDFAFSGADAEISIVNNEFRVEIKAEEIDVVFSVEDF